MGYQLSWNYHFGRVTLALAVILFGYNLQL